MLFQDCPVYWPLEEGSTERYGPIEVSLVSLETGTLTTREFDVTLEAKVDNR